MRLCEPCGYHREEREATGSRGMDSSPVCDWHLKKSWANSVEELERVYYSPDSNLTKYRVEEIIKVGAAAIRRQEKMHRDNDMNPLLGYADRADVAAKIVVEALLVRDWIR